MALLNFSSLSSSLKSVFKTASLSTEQINLVRKASSIAASCRSPLAHVCF